MTTPLLLTVLVTRPSKRKRLAEFKKANGILTMRSDLERKDHPWIAIVPFTEDMGKDIFNIMADSCRLYEESGHLATGTGELSAVRELARQLNIACAL